MLPITFARLQQPAGFRARPRRWHPELELAIFTGKDQRLPATPSEAGASADKQMRKRNDTAPASSSLPAMLADVRVEPSVARRNVASCAAAGPRPLPARYRTVGRIDAHQQPEHRPGRGSEAGPLCARNAASCLAGSDRLHAPGWHWCRRKPKLNCSARRGPCACLRDMGNQIDPRAAIISDCRG